MSFNVLGYDLTLSELISLSCSLFLTVFYAVKTHGLKNIIKEVLNMKYKFKTEQSVEPTKGQTFPTTKPIYRLNRATDELEDTGDTVDLQAVINSCIDTALDRALDRLLPKVAEAKDVAELDIMREDLDFAMEACNRAEDYREKYNLPSDMSVTAVYDFVAKQAEILKAKVDTAEAVKKEVKDDEKEKN